MISASGLEIGDRIEFDLQPEHWDALLEDADRANLDVELSRTGLRIRGKIVELLDRPRIVISVEEFETVN